MSEKKLSPELSRAREISNRIIFGGTKFSDSGRETNIPGEILDSYAGAPVRKLVNELQKGNFNSSALKRAYERIGGDPNLSPTGEDIVRETGITNPYAVKGLGFIADNVLQIPIPMRGISPGAAGIIEKVDRPLFHGSPNEFALNEAIPSKSGHAGPGTYFTESESLAKSYGDNVLATVPGKTKIIDLYDNKETDLKQIANELGLTLDDRLAKGPMRRKQYDRLKEAFLQINDPERKLVGIEKDKALIGALKQRGYKGIKYDLNEDPAYNFFDAKNLSPAQKYNIKSTAGEINLESKTGRASLVDGGGAEGMVNYDKNLNKYADYVENPAKLEHIESFVPGYGTKIINKVEKAAINAGYDSIYLNASPLGLKKDLPKLIRFYEKNGYEVVNHEGSNAVMFKILSHVGEP